MRFNAKDLLKIVIEQANVEGHTISQQLIINAYKSMSETPISDKDDLEFFVCVLNGWIEDPSTLMRELYNRTMGFKTEIVYAMIDTLNDSLLHFVQWNSLVDAFKHIESEANVKCDDIGEFIVDTLTDDELLRYAPGVYHWVMEELEKKIGKKRENDKKSILPPELDTDRARKYFARAVELGYMERTDTGYRWLYGGNRGLARLGYFVEKIYCSNNTEQLPESAINTLFGVNRIASAINQLYNATKPQKWRSEIDKIFDD